MPCLTRERLFPSSRPGFPRCIRNGILQDCSLQYAVLIHPLFLESEILTQSFIDMSHRIHSLRGLESSECVFSADGQRFLVNATEQRGVPPLTVITNWHAKLKK